MLGLVDADELSEAQQVRVVGLLERVSDEFQRLTGRLYTDGATRVRVGVVDGRAWFPGAADGVNSVELDGVEVDFEQVGNSVSVTRNGCPVPTGEVVVVDYNGVVPVAVTALVASIVARHLTVQPGESKVTSMVAGPFSQRFADWVSGTGLFTDDERESLCAYRIPVPSVVIQRL